MRTDKQAIARLRTAERRRVARLAVMSGMIADYASELPCELAEEARFRRTLKNTATRICNSATKRLLGLYAGDRDEATRALSRAFERIKAECTKA